jgi:outer membrane protein OmpA-like peptidoglycan-associated protein
MVVMSLATMRRSSDAETGRSDVHRRPAMAMISKIADRRLAMSGALVLAMATPSFGQSDPSQADFARALRPIPAVLQGGTQGLPTIVAPARPTKHPDYLAASARVGGEPARSAAARGHAAILAGCPAEPTAADQPMIGFKIAFEFGSARLEPQSLATLRNLGRALNQDLADQKRFEIQGHTDAVGSFTYNQQLSAARAEAVRDFLVRQMGVSADRLVATGKSYCEPADPRDPDAAANRRVAVLNQSS